MARITSRARSMRRRSQPVRRAGSLKSSEAFTTFVLDQLEALRDVVPRSMFGGIGLYYRGIFFGIIARDMLYLKTDEENRRDYERADMPPFRPYPHRPVTMRYHAVPVDVLESAPELVRWARTSVAAAERSTRGRVRRR